MIFLRQIHWSYTLKLQPILILKPVRNQLYEMRMCGRKSPKLQICFSCFKSSLNHHRIRSQLPYDFKCSFQFSKALSVRRTKYFTMVGWKNKRENLQVDMKLTFTNQKPTEFSLFFYFFKKKRWGEQIASLVPICKATRLNAIKCWW